MPGYILLDLDKEEIPAKYMCSFCGFLLRDARQTPCGHFYCDECVASLVIDNTFFCVEDLEQCPIDQVYTDNFVRREVLSLVVRCINTETGCKWRGEVRHVTNHTANCPYQKIKCDHPGCDVMLLRKDLPDHLLNECEYRLITCAHCGIDVSLADMQKHQTIECVKMPIVCPKCNTEGIPRDRMPIHLNPLRSECHELEGPCPYSTLGCPAKEVMNKERRAKHIKNDIHLNLIQKDYPDLKRELAEAVARIHFLESSQGMSNSAMTDTEIAVRDLSLVTYDGTLVWKIDQVARRREDAIAGRTTSFYSHAFYSIRHGYKMCARIYLNGDGIGRGNSISLYFVIMRGEYDGLLRWPFRHKVTLMLLDQDHVDHVIDAFHPDPTSLSFQRPQTNMNIASGLPLFCPLTELSKHAYIRDDTIFIKVIVDPFENE